MKQEKDATTRVAKYSELRNEIKNMPDDGSFNDVNGKNNRNYTKTQTIPINNQEMFETSPLNIEEKGKNKKFNNAEVFKKYKFNKHLVTLLYVLIGVAVLVLLICLIVWMAKTL